MALFDGDKFEAFKYFLKINFSHTLEEFVDDNLANWRDRPAISLRSKKAPHC